MTDRDWQWTAFAIPWNVFVHKQLGADDNFDIRSLLITTFWKLSLRITFWQVLVPDIFTNNFDG